LALALVALACGGPGGAEHEYTAAEGRSRTGGGDATAESIDVPMGRLPAGVTPTSYSIWLEVIPSRERFRGRVEIDVELAEPTERIFLHGQDLHVTQVEVLPADDEPVVGRYRQMSDTGVAMVSLDAPLPAGQATLVFDYDAPFDRQLKGLYRVDTGGESYAFTQFEATSARYAFPCFDEPRFKTPFSVTLAVQQDHEAIANTQPMGLREVEGLREVRFATTEPLPTYLVAIAVGPLDVVEHAPIPPNAVRDRPLPFRGVAVRGQGPRLAYALEHTAPLLESLERYFGIAYPYDKLDIIAVPDFASGAMENAGAITFRETLLLLDPDHAPEGQRRAMASVMAHELAHQWFGNLVTMPWWDDIWLNEAFATWMGAKTIAEVHPDYQADVGRVRGTQYAMGTDSLMSARQIRQPIESDHDIRNAFDSITYSKGGGVLSMFERWIGADTFRDGVREHLNRHRFGTATSEDLLDALSQLAGRDVSTPFTTFLEQPGVPLVDVEMSCSGSDNHLTLRQRRYLPLGSGGTPSGTWQIPFCARWGRGAASEDRCELITEPEATFDLGARCPEWVMPNAEAAGYYRYTVRPEEVDRLMTRGWARLSTLERMSLASNLSAAYSAGTLDTPAVFGTFARMASDPSMGVATSPMGLVHFAHDDLVPEALRPNVERFAAGLYAGRVRTLGWAPRRGRTEPGETSLLRAEVLGFMAYIARDAAVRAEAARRGRAYLDAEGEASERTVDANLREMVLAVAVEDGDAALFDRLLERALASDDALFRTHALWALGRTRDPELGARVLALGLDPRLRANEITIPLSAQTSFPERRDAAFEWLRANWDGLAERLATTRAGSLPWTFSPYCAEDDAEAVQAFFTPRVDALPGGPRNLAGALEVIRLCAARSAHQRESAERFFAR
ncbi:MAG: M1 family metallopeptidase, partial [Sandaracinaceae bacterium]